MTRNLLLGVTAFIHELYPSLSQELTQGTFICSYEPFESHEWLTDDLSAYAVGSSQKSFLLIYSDCFEVSLFCLIALHTQQLKELRYCCLFEENWFVKRL